MMKCRASDAPDQPIGRMQRLAAIVRHGPPKSALRPCRVQGLVVLRNSKHLDKDVLHAAVIARTVVHASACPSASFYETYMVFAADVDDNELVEIKAHSVSHAFKTAAIQSDNYDHDDGLRLDVKDAMSAARCSWACVPLVVRPYYNLVVFAVRRSFAEDLAEHWGWRGVDIPRNLHRACFLQFQGRLPGDHELNYALCVDVDTATRGVEVPGGGGGATRQSTTGTGV
jgi:hypothetical protein